MHSNWQKTLVYCGNLFGWVVESESFVSRRYYRRKTFFKKLINFFILDCQQKLLRRLANFLVGFPKLTSMAPKEIFGGKRFFGIETFSIIFRLSDKDFRASVKLSEVSLKIYSICAEEHFGNCFRDKKMINFGFSAENSRTFAPLQDVRSCLSKNSFHVSRGINFWGNRILRKKIIHFLCRSLERMFQTYALNFWAELLNCALRIQSISSGKKFIEMLCIIVFTGFRARSFDPFEKSSFSRKIKEAFYVPKRKFWE